MINVQSSLELLPRPIVAIHQPAYLPWSGYLHRIYRADVFVFLDNVQFQKNSFQNRNKLRTRSGWTWLTLPIETKGHTGGTLSTTRIANSDWQRRHWATISQCYARAARSEAVLGWMEPFYKRDYQLLSELTWDMLGAHLDALGMRRMLVRASRMAGLERRKSDLVLDICRAMGAKSYLSGPLGRGYLRTEDFAEAGMVLAFDDYVPPTYTQAHPGFEQYMAAIDLMANVPDPLALIATAGGGQMGRSIH